jgi:hypothetical protein
MKSATSWKNGPTTSCWPPRKQLRNTKARIAQLKRDARKAATLQEQSGIQRELPELERKQRRQRQEIFAVEDEIIAKRDELIASLCSSACRKKPKPTKTPVHPALASGVTLMTTRFRPIP